MRSIIAYMTLFFMVGSLGVPPVAAALEMSSKRDCAVCHVMWMDDFRTDKETLIEWQPGNVLMKDTQGVVSSEEMCYSCHDGYVEDSRKEAWKYHNHKTFVKPSRNVSIPSALPLSVKDEIYCGTCHTVHGPAAEYQGPPPGPTSFLRVKNADSSLCETCHLNKAEFRRTNGHPLKTTALDIPESLFRMGSRRGTEKNKIICQTCHRVHGAQGENITVFGGKASELCTACHLRQEALVNTSHDLRFTLPDAKNNKGDPVDKSGPCGACHRIHHAAGKWLWARRPLSGNPASGVCLSCHGPESGYRIKGIGQYSHPLDSKGLSRGRAAATLPLFTAAGVRDPAGKIGCLTCHDPHQWNPRDRKQRRTKEVEGSAADSFLRVAAAPDSTLCKSCHPDQETVLAAKHNLSASAPEAKNLQGMTPVESGPCGACHIPHNAGGARLWARMVPSGNPASAMCLSCHGPGTVLPATVIGANSHPLGVAPSQGSAVPDTLPLYGASAIAAASGTIQCLSCHDPHRWSPVSGGGTNAKEIRADASNSFLRVAAAPDSSLCIICHQGRNGVLGTGHDLTRSAPEAKNIQGRLPSESGLCGACHLAHNSPHPVRLWAREYGPVPEAETAATRFCIGCHVAGGAASKRIPAVASHPRGRLITNVMRFAPGKSDYTALYSPEGKESRVGEISCPSCHDPHRWNPWSGEKGGGSDAYRFLRTLGENTVCRECHGPDGYFRYLYYHDPSKRPKKPSDS